MMQTLPFKLTTKHSKGRTIDTTIGAVQGAADRYWFENVSSDADNTGKGMYHEGGIWCHPGTRTVFDYDGVAVMPARVLIALKAAGFDVSEIVHEDDAERIAHLEVWLAEADKAAA